MAARTPRRQRISSERPDMADVARLAGVSAQTVSRALRGHPSVRPATQTRVMAAVAELGYRPNNVARALSTGRTRTIGVISESTIAYSNVAVLHGIEHAARRAGYFVTSVSIDPTVPANLYDAMGRLAGQGVDGLILAVAAVGTAVGPVEAVEVGLPVVTIAHSLPESIPMSVDQHRAGRLATEHLLELGHATVWHVAGPSSSDGAVGRAEGWRAALADAGREPPPMFVGDWSAASGYRLGRDLAVRSDVTAVFVASDDMAFGLVRALADAGRDVPGDVAVVSMDDIPLAAHARPPLTTVRQPFARLGEVAVHGLLLGDGAPVVLEPELVVRASSGVPPAG